MQPKKRDSGKPLESLAFGSTSLHEALLYRAADKHSLKNHGVEEEASRMFEMGEETMRLPLEEKMKYEQGDDGRSFGSVIFFRCISYHSHLSIRYKAAGSSAVDASGQQDTMEFINVSKDDALAYPDVVNRTYPSTVNERMESTITPFVTKSVQVNDTILEIFNDKLGLLKGTLKKRHPKDEYSGSEARTTKNPPGYAPDRMAIGAHTDFGSLSFLHNRLGGLQVLPPGYTEWQYVKVSRQITLLDLALFLHDQSQSQGMQSATSATLSPCSVEVSSARICIESCKQDAPRYPFIAHLFQTASGPSVPPRQVVASLLHSTRQLDRPSCFS